MSNSMSSSKSRWKGALLAAVAGAAVSPMMAHAQSMTVGAYLSPIGSTPAVSKYIDPYDPVNVYVYATVTGTSSPSLAYSDGLSFLYFNVNGAVTGTTGLGTLTSNLSPLFGGGAFNGGGGVLGSQTGTVSAITTTPGVVVGSATDPTQMVKPRTYNDGYYYNGSSGTAPAVVVQGNSVSFLVDTLTYTPNKTAILADPSGHDYAGTSVSFNVSAPTSVVTAAGLVPSNYFVGVNTSSGVNNQGIGGSAGASNTSSAYTSTGTTVTLTNALPGDTNLDGTVNGADFTTLVNNFNNQNNNGVQYGTPQWGLGDFNGDGYINGTDFTTLVNQFNNSLGGAPAGLVGPAGAAALIAGFDASGGATSVPEPASLALVAVGLVPLLSRRRNRA